MFGPIPLCVDMAQITKMIPHIANMARGIGRYYLV